MVAQLVSHLVVCWAQRLVVSTAGNSEHWKVARLVKRLVANWGSRRVARSGTQMAALWVQRKAGLMENWLAVRWGAWMVGNWERQSVDWKEPHSVVYLGVKKADNLVILMAAQKGCYWVASLDHQKAGC